MTRSVRAGGFAVAAFFAALFAGAPAHAETAPATLEPVATQAATLQAPAPVASPGGLVTVEAQPALAPAAAPQPAFSTGQTSLEQLAAALAATDTVGNDQECLATAVYFEARGEPLAGQLAVAEVVLNRARSGRYPPDVCAVVKQPWQFSFVRKGRFPPADRASASWKRAVAIARIAQDKLAAELPQSVLWYHADYVAPSLGKRLTRQTKIGLHIFYS